MTPFRPVFSHRNRCPLLASRGNQAVNCAGVDPGLVSQHNNYRVGTESRSLQPGVQGCALSFGIIRVDYEKHVKSRERMPHSRRFMPYHNQYIVEMRCQASFDNMHNQGFPGDFQQLLGASHPFGQPGGEHDALDRGRSRLSHHRLECRRTQPATSHRCDRFEPR
jgi:hypothetical protein